MYKPNSIFYNPTDDNMILITEVSFDGDNVFFKSLKTKSFGILEDTFENAVKRLINKEKQDGVIYIGEL